DAVVGPDLVVAVAAELGPRRRGRGRLARGAVGVGPAAGPGLRQLDAGTRLGPRRRGEIGQGQVQGEGAPLARHAPNADLPAEQAGDLAADRQAQARATVL